MATRPAAPPLTRSRVARPALSERHYKWTMLLPSIAVVLGLMIFPLVFTLWISFTDWHLFRFEPPGFNGLRNWATLVSDSNFLVPARNTIVFTAGVVPTQFLIGLVVALALNNCTFGRAFFRIFFLLPIMVSPVAISFVMGRTIFDQSIGPVHDLLLRLGLPQIPWLTDRTWAMITLMIIDSWGGTAFMILMFTAGLQGLPDEPYEAAKVDGASEWQLFRFITLPLLTPVMITAVLIRALDAFRVVDIVATVTGGGPGDATETITLRVFEIAVKGGDVAYGAAAAYGLLIIMAVFSSVFLLATRRARRGATGDA